MYIVALWLGLDVSQDSLGYSQPPRSTQPSTLRGMVNEYQLSGLSNNNDGDDGCSVLAAYRRAYGPGRLAWSKGRRPPGAVATFIA